MTGKEPTLAQLVRGYAEHVRYISDDYNWEDDTWHALVYRSLLVERWRELSERQRQEVVEVDQKLLAQRERVASLLPGPQDHPASEWWWHLHEPDVVVPQTAKVVA